MLENHIQTWTLGLLQAARALMDTTAPASSC
jgi:hypothetical protein